MESRKQAAGRVVSGLVPTAVQYIEASASSCGRRLGAGRFAQLLCEIFNELGGLWWGPLVHGARYVYSLRSTDVDSRHRDR